MGLIASGSNKEFRPVPEGSHMAVCYRVIDLGTQKWDYQGQEQIGRKVLLAWELHGEADDGSALTTDDGQPLSVSKKYTLSLGKKASLRADLESWRGKAFTDDEIKGFDVSTLLGAPCMVSIKHTVSNGKTYANVANVTRFPAALKNSKPKPHNTLQLLNLDEPDQRVLDTLPEWILNIINASMERSAPKPAPKAAMAGAGSAGSFEDDDSDIPFVSSSLSCDVIGNTRKINRSRAAR